MATVRSFQTYNWWEIDKIPPENQKLVLILKSMTVQTKLTKMNTYTSNEIYKRKNEKVNLLGMIVKQTFRFVRHYIFKGGIFRGVSGLLLSVNEANYKFYTLVKIWEARNAETEKISKWQHRRKYTPTKLILYLYDKYFCKKSVEQSKKYVQRFSQDNQAKQLKEYYQLIWPFKSTIFINNWPFKSTKNILYLLLKRAK